jgi:hypothetical protein
MASIKPIAPEAFWKVNKTTRGNWKGYGNFHRIIGRNYIAHTISSVASINPTFFDISLMKIGIARVFPKKIAH